MAEIEKKHLVGLDVLCKNMKSAESKQLYLFSEKLSKTKNFSKANSIQVLFRVGKKEERNKKRYKDQDNAEKEYCVLFWNQNVLFGHRNAVE